MTPPPPDADHGDVWQDLFDQPESDFLDLELLDAFLNHPDQPAERAWLLATAEP